MKTTATNGRTTPVSWDLWPNTRVRPEGFPYVPLDPRRCSGWTARGRTTRTSAPTRARCAAAGSPCPRPQARRAAQEALGEGLRAPARRASSRTSSASSSSLIRAPLVPRQKLHGEQAFIEIYRGAGKGATTSSSSRCTAPTRRSPPGPSTSFEQTFELLDYDGPETPEGHLARLRSCDSVERATGRNRGARRSRAHQNRRDRPLPLRPRALAGGRGGSRSCGPGPRGRLQRPGPRGERGPHPERHGPGTGGHRRLPRPGRGHRVRPARRVHDGDTRPQGQRDAVARGRAPSST